MKYFILLLFILPFCAISQDEKPVLFDQYSLNINHAFFSGYHAHGLPGFGLSASHTFRKDKIFELFQGFEFNVVRLNDDNARESKYISWDSLFYRFHFLTINAGMRYNFGERIKVFFELGAYAEIAMGSFRSGYMTNSGNWQQGPPVTTYIEDRGYNSGGNAGLQFAGGVELPLKKRSLVIKVDSKFGLTSPFDYDKIDPTLNYGRLCIGIQL